MPAIALPAEDNQFLAEHIGLLRRSLLHWMGRDLAPPRMNDVEAARFLFTAPFALLSHDTQPDPVFNYANQTAMSLFAMSWEDMTACPSRRSAEPVNQTERSGSYRRLPKKAIPRVIGGCASAAMDGGF
jgi:hypothetical protein